MQRNKSSVSSSKIHRFKYCFYFQNNAIIIIKLPVYTVSNPKKKIRGSTIVSQLLWFFHGIR